jgi:hypothetical protein
MRVTAVVVGSALMTMALAAPAAAAPPVREVVPVGAADEAELQGLFTSACGVPVRVEGTGKVLSMVFSNRKGQVVRIQEIYSQRFVITNIETGATSTIRDTGPDRVLFENGEPVILQQIGRSTTGSGTIGRTVFDIRGGRSEELSRSGKSYGDFVANTCAAIT